MKTFFSKSLLLLSLVILFGCTTPPVQESIQKIQKTVINDSSGSMSLFFPTFSYSDVQSGESKIVSGDCIIVLLPNGKTMMVDSFDTTGSECLVSFLRELGIKKIDYLIASHYHVDHIGGMIAVLDNFDIGEFYSNDAPFNSNSWHFLESYLKNNGIAINKLQQGDKLVLSEDPFLCTIDVLWPNLSEEDLYNIYNNPGKTERMKNNSSLVFKLQYKDFSVLFTGDVYKQGDREITKKYGEYLKSTILKVPHHGDIYTSNSFTFVKKVSPEIAIIQDPRYITYFISATYRLVGSTLLYRNSPGYIMIETDGSDYTVNEVSVF